MFFLIMFVGIDIWIISFWPATRDQHEENGENQDIPEVKFASCLVFFLWWRLSG